MEVRVRNPLGPLLLVYLLFLRSSLAACFLPNGTDRNTVRPVNRGDYLPCDATARVSMCCALGRQNNPDTCLPGGLCRAANNGPFWRESCTDETWNSSECVKLFVDGPGQRCHLRILQVSSSLLTLIVPDSTQDVNLSLCDNGSWCRGFNETGRQCCQQGQGFFIASGEATRINPNATTSSPSVDPTFVTSSPTTGPSPSRSSMSTGAKSGIGVGVGLGVVAIIAVVGILALRRRRRGKKERGMEGGKEVSPQRTSQYDESLARPSTAMYSAGDFPAESVELESRSLGAHDRLSYLSYRAPGHQDGPAELPSEKIPTKHDSRRSA